MHFCTRQEFSQFVTNTDEGEAHMLRKTTDTSIVGSAVPFSTNAVTASSGDVRKMILQVFLAGHCNLAHGTEQGLKRVICTPNHPVQLLLQGGGRQGSMARRDIDIGGGVSLGLLQMALSQLLQSHSTLVLLALVVHNQLFLASGKHPTHLTVVLCSSWGPANNRTVSGFEM